MSAKPRKPKALHVEPAPAPWPDPPKPDERPIEAPAVEQPQPQPGSRCDRCGHKGGETFKVAAVGWAGELAASRHKDGAAMSDGCDLCPACKAEFVAMMATDEHRYSGG